MQNNDSPIGPADIWRNGYTWLIDYTSHVKILKIEDVLDFAAFKNGGYFIMAAK